MTVTLDDIEAAERRIADLVRRTPVLDAGIAKAPLNDTWGLALKLECLQITGSFKARGAASTLTALSEAEIKRGLVTASGGNHGLGVAFAGWSAGAPVKIFLPSNTPPVKAEKLATWGAEVVMYGAVWDEANEEGLRVAEAEGLTYVHPFADPRVIAGQGTAALELMRQVPDCDVMVVAIGGGGLIAGMAAAAKAIKPDITVIGVEPVGAPTHHASRKAGRVVTLDKIETAANTLAPRRSAEINFELISAHVDDIVLVEDEAMRRAARWLWAEFGVAAELSGAAAVAALQDRAYVPPAGSTVAALVCGAGSDGMD